VEIEKLVSVALAAVLAAAAVGQLPLLVREVRIAQLQLLKDSETSHWGKPFLLPIQPGRGKGRRSLPRGGIVSKIR